MSEGLRARVQRLVDRYHDGVVARAAEDTGVTQPTLHRLLHGDVQNPRLDVLRRLAAFYNVSLEWLAEGRGEEPDYIQPTAGFLRWQELLKSIDLSDTAYAKWLRVPNDPLESVEGALVEDTLIAAPLEVNHAHAHAFVGAQDHIVRAWESYVRQLLAEFDRDRLRTEMEKIKGTPRVAWAAVTSLGLDALKPPAKVKRKRS